MGFLTLALEFYFVAVLGVSGLVKIDDPGYVATVFRQQRLLPTWSISAASRLFPWFEVLVALFLLSGIFPITGAFVLTSLFLFFLLVKCVLLALGRTEDCGCYGRGREQKIDGPSIIVSCIFVALTGLHLWLTLRFSPVSWSWRLAGALLMLGAGCYLIVNMLIGHHQLALLKKQHLEIISGLEVGTIAPNFTAIDQQGQPFQLNDLEGRKRILAFVAPGCPSCTGTLAALAELLHSDQGPVGLIIGTSDEQSNQDYVQERRIHLPFLTPNDTVEQVYRVQSYPLVFALDEQGVIRGKDVVNIKEHLQALLLNAYPPAVL